MTVGQTNLLVVVCSRMDFDAVWLEDGGWLRVDELGVRVRFVDSDDGRLEPVSVEMIDDAALTVRTLQRIPFGRIEAAANGSQLAELLRDRIANPDKDTPALVFDLRETGNRIADPQTLKSSTFTRAPTFPKGTVVMGLSPSHEDTAERVMAILASEPARYGDEFYRAFAALYEWEATRSERPGAALSERLDVPIGRVWRWVRVCRTKGYLAPSRSGTKEA